MEGTIHQPGGSVESWGTTASNPLESLERQSSPHGICFFRKINVLWAILVGPEGLEAVIFYFFFLAICFRVALYEVPHGAPFVSRVFANRPTIRLL